MSANTTQLSSTALLAIDLIKRPTLTPLDCDAQSDIAKRLQTYGFKALWLNKNEVTNMWLYRASTASNAKNKLMVLAGHTDVVPTGDINKWTYPPFSADIINGVIYGRGGCDMKGGLAALITATERFLDAHADTSIDIAFLITSDEEGPAVDGSAHVVDYLLENNIKPDWCILAEPSSTNVVGDVIKNGRRGSLTGWATLHGKQGHVGYPHLANNPNHALPSYIQSLLEVEWDKGNDYFDPTTFQIVNISSGEGTTNVIPEEAKFDFNWRFSSELNQDLIKAKVISCFDKIQQETGVSYSIDWKLFGDPFLTTEGTLVNTAKQAIKRVLDIDTKLSTSGGTSDGRFIAKTGCQIIELGTTNATIHKINECVAIEEIDKISSVYEEILKTIV